MSSITTNIPIHAAFTARAGVGGFVLVAGTNRSVRVVPGSAPLTGTVGLVTTK